MKSLARNIDELYKAIQGDLFTPKATVTLHQPAGESSRGHLQRPLGLGESYMKGQEKPGHKYLSREMGPNGWIYHYEHGGHHSLESTNNLKDLNFVHETHGTISVTGHNGGKIKFQIKGNPEQEISEDEFHKLMGGKEIFSGKDATRGGGDKDTHYNVLGEKMIYHRIYDIDDNIVRETHYNESGFPTLEKRYPVPGNPSKYHIDIYNNDGSHKKRFNDKTINTLGR